MPTSPSDLRRPCGQPPRPADPAGQRARPRRRPAWSTAIALGALLPVIAATACSTTGSGSIASSSLSPSPSSPPSASPTADATTLSCGAQALRPRPADHTIARIQVSTVAHARVTVTGPLPLVPGEPAAGRASATGTRMLRFEVGDARPGATVVITVQVSRLGITGSCQASLRPRAAAVAAVAAPPQPTSAPPAAAAPQPTAAAPPPPPAASCHPLSDEGTCYEPGEFCRDDDHGVTGVAGNGETIVCEDNDGWRWEPA
jgi:hypothetical protein